MLIKGTKLYSILRMKCPRCQKGKFFKSHPYNFSKMGEVKEQCSECYLRYSLEPSFYQGSYYVAYALGVALFVTVWVLKLLLYPTLGPGGLLISIFVSLFLFSPLLYALSKIIWINFFIKYKRDATETVKKNKC